MSETSILAIVFLAGLGIGLLGALRLPIPAMVSLGLLGLTTVLAAIGAWRLGALALGSAVGLSVRASPWTQRQRISVVIILVLGGIAEARLCYGSFRPHEVTLVLAVVAIALGIAAFLTVETFLARAALGITATAAILLHAFYPSNVWFAVATAGLGTIVAVSAFNEWRRGGRPR
jgi:hypothetical protein